MEIVKLNNELAEVYGSVMFIKDNSLNHYGMPRRSGRYPYGSGEDPYQHAGDFISRVKKLTKEGFEYTDENGRKWTGQNAVAKSMGLSIKEFKVQYATAENRVRRDRNAQIFRMSEKEGLGSTEIGRRVGLPEGTVRSILKNKEKSVYNLGQAEQTANFIKKRVNEDRMVDVGKGVEKELGISRERLDSALYIMQMDGYKLYKGRIPTGPNKGTTQTVITQPGIPHKEIFKFENVKSLKDYESLDGGLTFQKTFVPPKSMDSKRIMVRYRDEGGLDRDGTIELRRGVQDLDLGGSAYSQVRILIDNKLYAKGMAVYGNDKDFPPGVDMIFNTNKPKGTTNEDVFKKIKKDPENPFGSLIKQGIDDPENPSPKRGGQSYYIDKKTGKKELSLINKRADEGDWNDWSDTTSSQFLSKQNVGLIKRQLGLATQTRKSEFDEIMKMTNPTIKKQFLQDFADTCDSAAEKLQGAALPRQKFQVILPVTSLKDNEVYAPNYEHGEQIALVRFPHQSVSEIPILTVNNNNPEGKRKMGTNPLDAVGINARVAERMSGADFDGDTVMAIPTNSTIKIRSRPTLKGLEGFDPKTAYGWDSRKSYTNKDGDEDYKYYDKNGVEYKILSEKNKGKEMGIVSNLITDMTLRGASDEKLARAIRHSQVVIDAPKHKLDYQRSYEENGIAALKKEFQGHIDDRDGRYHEGASTIISKAKSTEYIDKRQGTGKVNQKGKPWYDASKPEGVLVYNKAQQQEYIDKKTGKVHKMNSLSTKMAEANDARELSSGHPIEEIYAGYANDCKDLARRARLEMVKTGDIKVNAEAKKKYKTEVDSLMAKLKEAELNAPRERQANRYMNAMVNAKKEANPDMTKSEIKKEKARQLAEGRAKFGAKGIKIDITPKEYEAIQAGALAASNLSKICKKADKEKLRELTMPKEKIGLPEGKINTIKSMASSKYSTEEIAKRLGVSTATVRKYLK